MVMLPDNIPRVARIIRDQLLGSPHEPQKIFSEKETDESDDYRKADAYDNGLRSGSLCSLEILLTHPACHHGRGAHTDAHRQ